MARIQNTEISLNPKQWDLLGVDLPEDGVDNHEQVRNSVIRTVIARFPKAFVSYHDDFGINPGFSGSFVNMAPYYVIDRGCEYHFTSLAYVVDYFNTVDYPVSRKDFFKFLIRERELPPSWIQNCTSGLDLVPNYTDLFLFVSRRVARWLVEIHWPMAKIEIINGLQPQNVARYYSGFLDPAMEEHVNSMLPMTKPAAISELAKQVLRDNVRRKLFQDAIKSIGKVQ